MPHYRCLIRPGGTFFFTLVTENRAAILCEDTARKILHDAIADCASRRPFALEAMVLLPDHAHLMMTLPDGDSDYSTRIAGIKATFTRGYLAAGGSEQPRSASRQRKRRRGIWQRWFWEHAIRDDDDYEKHFDYTHWNPVKHGLVTCPHEWDYSTFQRSVRQGVYEQDWQCACDGRIVKPPDFKGLNLDQME